MTPQEIREQQKKFRTLALQVAAFLAKMDVVMAGQKSTVERGEKIAELCNQLEMANDIALRFGLGLERRGTKLRKVKR